MNNPRPSLFIAALALVLYLTTLSNHYSADSILHARAVESGLGAALLQPEHLLLRPLGWAFFRVWQWLGWQGNALLPLQTLNALGGAVCVGILFRSAQHISGAALAAALAACGFAVSGGLWLLSTDAEFVTVPLAVQLTVLSLTFTMDAERARRPSFVVWLGLASAFATLTYLTSAFLVLVIGLSIVWQRELPARTRRKQLVLYAAVTVLSGLGALVCLHWLDGGFQLLQGFAGSQAYGQWQWSSLPNGGYAFLRSLALYPNLGMNDRTSVFFANASSRARAFFVGYYALVLALALAPCLCVKRLWPTQRNTLSVLSVWCALFAAFAFYWVPNDISFWMPLLGAWWLTASLCVAQVVVRSHWRTIGAASLIVCLAAANALFLIVPNHDLSRNRPYALAAQVAALTTADDLILTNADGTEFLYVEYFARRSALPLTDIGLLPAIARVRARGGRVFLVGDAPNAALAPNRVVSATNGATWQRRADAIWELSP